MIVISQDTENSFKTELNIKLAQPDSWRCLLFEFSKIPEKKDGWFSQVLDIISSCLGEDGSRAFLFDNEDVNFILKHATQRSFLTVVAQLSKLFNSKIDDLCFLYELHVDMQKLQEVAEQRVQSKISLQPVIENSNTFIFDNKKYYEELTGSLNMRRHKRIEPTILVIEDDPFSLRLVSKTLTQNYKLMTAEDGGSGFESYLINAPDILFLDIGLPDTNGLTLMEKIFAADPAAYIVILSGNGNRENVIQAIQKGAKGFVAKPFAREKLFQYIDKSPFIKQKTMRVY